MSHSALKIQTRLSIGFGTVCTLLLIILAIGLHSMNRINDSLVNVVDDRWPKIEAANDVLTHIDAIAIALRNMLLSTDPADQKKQIEDIAESRQIIGKSIDLLKSTVALPRGKQLLQDVIEKREAYLAGQEALMALIAAERSDEAKSYLNNKLRPTLLLYKKATIALIGFQVGIMDATAVDAAKTYAQAQTTLMALGAVALVVAALLGLFITRQLLQELGGEPGLAADLVRTVAQGDFTRTVVVKAGDEHSLMAHLGTMQKDLSHVVAKVRHSSEDVASASAEIAQGNRHLSERTENQASALEETAASMEQLSATVKQNAENARQGNELASAAATVAVKGGDVVGQVVETMKGINNSSRKISEIISVIDGIAFQTNILALNAAVEAARAGEQGRGFAVVASEVRSLAGRSADAAKEIKGLIEDSVRRVDEGSALVDQAGATMSEVVSAIGRVSGIMGEISAASQEQSIGVAQVGEAVMQMDQVTQQNVALVEEMSTAAAKLNDQSQELVQSVAIFKLGAGMQHYKPAPSAAPKAPPRTPSPAAKPAKPAPAPTRKLSAPSTQVAAKPAPKAIGNDDDWTNF